jgi:hypothetical protein
LARLSWVFIATGLLRLIILVAFPVIALWLPQQM